METLWCFRFCSWAAVSCCLSLHVKASEGKMNRWTDVRKNVLLLRPSTYPSSFVFPNEMYWNRYSSSFGNNSFRVISNKGSSSANKMPKIPCLLANHSQEHLVKQHCDHPPSWEKPSCPTFLSCVCVNRVKLLLRFYIRLTLSIH